MPDLATPPLRIALLTHSVNPRGGVVHVLELGRALQQAGQQVTLIAPAAPGQRFFRDTPCAAEIAALPSPPQDAPTDLAAQVAARIQAVRTHLQHTRAAERFDLLHAHDGIGANALADLKAQGSLRGYVRTVHHVDRFADEQVQAWEARSLREAGLLLCVSRLWQQRLHAEHGLAAHEVPNGVDLQRYHPAPQPEDAALARVLGLERGAPLVLAMGTAFGAFQGLLIERFRLQPFIVTLAGMFLARGLCYLISIDSISITEASYSAISQYRLPLGEEASLSVGALIAIAVVLLAVFIAHCTPFGRTVYAIGGNEHSAVLMGLPVRSTVVGVYTLSGFCSALAGVVFTFYMLSGYGLHAVGLELDAIAAVVIGGTLLTGGVGYVAGTLFGVLTLGVIQTLIAFDGTLSSWWTRIVIGALLFFFCLLQRFFTSRPPRR